MHSDHIVISGARENNLKDVSLRIPKEKIVVFTGVSGSGKSSIVFDTIAIESQRQLNETFTWFIRNRLPKHERPDADVIDDLSTAIVVDQRPIGGNSRSTVGTMTDIHSVLRVLFSRYGTPSAGGAGAYSFNDPHGMCPECDGLGRVVRLDLDKLLDTSKSLNEGAIDFPQVAPGTWQWGLYAKSGLFDPDKPLREYTEEEWELLLHGKGFKLASGNTYQGLADRFERLWINRDLSSLSDKNREAALRVTTERTCPLCDGARLNQDALAARIDGHSIADHCRMEISDLIAALGRIRGGGAEAVAATAVTRLRRLEEIGLGYLSLDRETSTVSGGEGQRLKVVRHLGSSLTGMTYIFDEPSVGMHPRDVGRLNALLRQLRDRGNTVLVVEHDPDVIRVADHIVDMGPGAGTAGGQVVFEGTLAQLERADTPTGIALRRGTGVKDAFREPTGWLTVTADRLHNLTNVTARFPAGVLSVVTGVAGSGKSTLVSRVLVGAHPGAIVVDQSAIAASRRSSPATYLGMMDQIRRLFADASGADAGLFSFNSKGACPECDGNGFTVTDLAYMDPVTTRCPACGGTRYRPEALAHTLHGRTIVDVLAMTAEEALAFFTEHGGGNGNGGAKIVSRLRALNEVGLGYLGLGQPLSTLSGGERQRVKLAVRLRETGAVYVLDEPTTGLHMADVDTLVALMDRLVDAGNTVIVIEHNLDVVKRADWIIDLGPGGGKHGGRVIFAGTPADLLADTGSRTAEHLRRDVARAA
ncbi:excinuclease ABC subunit UvrA [Actinomadura barringtoniae]|uniref:UvrABC system protein A n=1 Tax=Actinomadura barringtoniae TaxID=1427535 RepID=A0A939T6A0_9ACTN|nr:excinuclease ABC subunit UvrA [Actinomadura barringtoniae]MBO2454686.1 excinuclease ABC subunit UvrA [Actinomadura barringtoniae]